MKKLIVLAAVAMLLVVGCGKKADYYPLTVGNIWEYTTTTHTTHTDTLVNDTTITSSYKNEITGEATLDNGDAAFVLVSTPANDTAYLVEKDNCVLTFDNLADTEGDTALVTPVEEGTTWIAFSDTLGNTLRVTIQEKVSGITVPAGTYDDVWKSIMVSNYGSVADTSDGWLAPNVGNIKMEHVGVLVVMNDTVTTTTTTELETVTIK